MKKSFGYSQHTKESVGQFKTVLLAELGIPKCWSNSALKVEWSSWEVEWSSGVVEWSSGVVEQSSVNVEWSSGVVEWSNKKVEWSSGGSGVVQHES